MNILLTFAIKMMGILPLSAKKHLNVHETSTMSLEDVPEWSLEGVSREGLWRGSNIIGKEQNFTTICLCFSTKTRLESSKYHVDFVFTH